MKKYIEEISNSLYINYQHVDSYGLLNGKMGIAIFFYEYSLYRKDESYNIFADYILDEVLDTVKESTVLYDLHDGISGVAWGIQYLISKKFVEGDPDDVLSDFDKKIQTYIDQLNTCNIDDAANHFCSNADALLSVDFYLLFRYADRNLDVDNLNIIISFYNKILNTEKKFYISFLNSILAFLYRLRDIDLCKAHCANVYDEVLDALKKSAQLKLYNKEDIILLFKLLSLFEDKKGTRSFTEIFDQSDIGLLGDNFDIKTLVKQTWQELVYFNEFNSGISETIQNIQKYIEEKISNIETKNITLNDGLAGLGLGLINSSKRVSF